MSRDKQIEEMAKDLLNVSNKVSNIIMEETHEFLSQNHKYSSLKDFHEAHSKGRNLMEAELLTELGYRKASEVAREIFGEIEKMLLDNHIGHYKTTKDTWTYNFNNEILTEIAELKKKYTEGKDV